MTDPGTHLVSPTLPDESMTNGFVNPIDVLNYASPTAWINKGIEAATGFDVIGNFMEAVSGDWEAIWKFGEAMGHLADCMAELGIDVQQGMLQLDDSWDGNAADAAYLYFSNLATGISGSQYDFRQIQEDYQQAALGTWQLANQLGNILQAIVDAWLIGLAAAGAGAAVSATGVGAFAGYALAGVQAARIAKLINDASLKINTAGTAIMAIFATPMTLANRGGDLSNITLPTAAYTTPGGPELSDDPVDQELERMAGSRQAAAEVKRHLIALRDGAAGPELAEMARDVLDGRISFRDVARSSAYAEPLMNAQESFLRWQSQVEDEERARLVTEAQKRLYGDQGS